VSVVKVNAIDVPDDRGEEIARRFAARIGEVDQQDGFEEFQLLRPEDGRGKWLVYTRWRDDEAFNAWVTSPAFTRGHAQPEGDSRPVGTHSELWAFSVAQHTLAGGQETAR
jgi:heme-degrading monooxygenase HmoA